MESIIGKKYISYDNSWSVNVTSCGDILSRAEHSYLAGTNEEMPKMCTIVSEPFECNVYSTGIKNPKSIRTMIMVNYNYTTNMVLFYKNNIL